jgi:hypothetical protein
MYRARLRKTSAAAKIASAGRGLSSRAAAFSRNTSSDVGAKRNFAVKKTGSKRTGKASNGIPSLLSSIQQHRKFKQLATYSIECVTKVVDPLHSNCEWNVKECVDCNISSAITDVLRLHQNDDHVLLTATKCLSYIGVHADISEVFVTGSGLDAMLASTKATKPHDGTPAGMSMEQIADVIETAAQLTDPALPTLEYTQYAVETTIFIMKKFKDQAVTEACLKLLMNMARNPIAAKMIVDLGGLGVILEAMKNASDNVVAMAFQLLNQLAGGGLGDDIKNAGSLKNIVAAMMQHLDNEPLLQSGSDLVKTLTGNDLDTALRVLKENDLTDPEMYFCLALDRGNAEGLIERDAIEAIIKTLRETDDALIMDVSARSLDRLATAPNHINRMIDAGGADALLGVFNKVDGLNGPDADMAQLDGAVGSAARTLAKLCDTPGHMKHMKDLGVLERVVQTLTEHPDWNRHALEAMRFFSKLRAMGDDLSDLVKLGGIEATIVAMRANHLDPRVQHAGADVLLDLCKDPANLKRMQAAGIVPLILQLLKEHKGDKQLVKKLLKLLDEVVGALPEALAELEELDGVGPVGAAAYTHRDDSAVRAAIVGVVKHVDTEKCVAPIDNLKAAHANQALSAEAFAELVVPNLMKTGAFAMHAPNVDTMMRPEVDGLSTLLDVMERLADPSAEFDGQEEALRVNFWALQEILRTKPDLSAEMLKRLVQSVLKVLNAFPRLADEAAICLQLLSRYPDAHDQMVEEGAIDMCVQLLKQNPTNEGIGEMVADTLGQFAQHDKFVKLIAQKGATHQCCEFMKRNAEGDRKGDFDDALLSMAKMLQLECRMPEVCDLLKQQGAVERLLDTMCQYKRKHQLIPEIAKVLVNLVELKDVLRDLALIKKVAKEIELTDPPDKIYGAVKRLGQLALVGGFAQDIVDHGGADALMEMVENVAKREPSEMRSRVIAVCLEALANIGLNAKLDSDGLRRLVPIVLAELKENGLDTDIAVIEFCEEFAKDDGARELLLQLDGAEQLFALMKEASAAGDWERYRALGDVLECLIKNDPTGECAKRLMKVGAVDWLADWLTENAATADPATLKTTMDLLAALLGAGLDMDHAKKQPLLDALVLDVLSYCNEQCLPELLTSALNLIEKMGGNPETAAQILEQRTAEKAVASMRAFPEYMADTDNCLGFIGMAEALFSNGGPDAAAQLEAQGVLDLLREMLNSDVLPEEVKLAAGRLIAKLAATGEGAELAAAMQQLEGLLTSMENGQVVDPLLVASTLSAVSNALLTMGQLGGDLGASVLEALMRAARLVGDKTALEHLTPGEYKAWQDALTAALQGLGRLVPQEAIELPMDELLKVIRIIMDQDPLKNDGSVTEACRTLGLMALHRGKDPAFMEAVLKHGVLGRLGDLIADENLSPELRAEALKTLQLLSSLLTGDMLAASADPAGLLAAMMEALLAAGQLQELHDMLSRLLKEGKLSDILDALQRCPDNLALWAEVLQAIVDAGIPPPLTEQLVQTLLQAIVKTQRSARMAHVGDEAKEEPWETATVDEKKLAHSAEQLLLRVVDLEEEGPVLRTGCAMIAKVVHVAPDPAKYPGAIMDAVTGHGVFVCLDAVLFANGVTGGYAAPGVEHLAGVRLPGVRAALGLSGGEFDTSPAQGCSMAKNLVGRMARFAAWPEQAGAEEVLHKYILILRALADNFGEGVEGDPEALLARLGLSAQDLDMLHELVQRYGMGHGGINSDGRALLESLGMALDMDNDFMFLDSLDAADPFSMVMDDGTAMYLNAVSEEMSGETPDEYLEMLKTLQKMCDAVSGRVIPVSRDALHKVVKTVKRHCADERVVHLGTKALSRLATDRENCMNIASFEESLCLADALSKHSLDEDINAFLMQLLDLLSKDPAFKHSIGAAGAIRSLIEALRTFVNRPLVVLLCIIALSSLAMGCPPNVKLMMELGIVDAMEPVMANYVDKDAAAAAGVPEAYGTPYPVGSKDSAIGVHILEKACVLFSNLMFDNEEVMVTICTHFVKPVLLSLERHCHEREPAEDFGDEGVTLFKMASRALGNMSICIENIAPMLKGRAVQTLVHGCRTQAVWGGKTTEALTMAVDVLGNLACLDPDAGVEYEDEEEEEGAAPPPPAAAAGGDDVLDGAGEEGAPAAAPAAAAEVDDAYAGVDLAEIIVLDEGIKVIAEAMAQFPYDVELLTACMDALCNLEDNFPAYDAMVAEKVVERVVGLLTTFQWDTELSLKAIELLALVSESDLCVPVMATVDTVSAVIEAMDKHGSITHAFDEPTAELVRAHANSTNVSRTMTLQDGPDHQTLAAQRSMFVEFGVVALKNVCSYAAGRQALQRIVGSVPDFYETVFMLMEENLRNIEMLSSAFGLLTFLSIDSEADVVSKEICEQGAHVIVACIRRHFKKPEFLAVGLTLWSQLAFCKANLPVLVQHGAIKIIISAISHFPEVPEVIKKCVLVLDNISSADTEYAAIVIETGGFDAIETIADAYTSDEEMQSLCQRARVSIQTMTLKLREKVNTSKDAAVLGQTLMNMDSSKITGRILKLRLKLQNNVDDHHILARDARTRKGMLSKSDPQGKNWKQRWFVLTPGRLVYYKRAKDESNADLAKGVVPLTPETQLKVQADGRNRAFQIVCPGVGKKGAEVTALDPSGYVPDRTFTLCARSPEEGRDWIESVRHNIALLTSEGEDGSEELPPPPPPPADEFDPDAPVSDDEHLDPPPPPPPPMDGDEHLVDPSMPPPPPPDSDSEDEDAQGSVFNPDDDEANGFAFSTVVRRGEEPAALPIKSRSASLSGADGWTDELGEPMGALGAVGGGEAGGSKARPSGFWDRAADHGARQERSASRASVAVTGDGFEIHLPGGQGLDDAELDADHPAVMAARALQAAHERDVKLAEAAIGVAVDQTGLSVEPLGAVAKPAGAGTTKKMKRQSLTASGEWQKETVEVAVESRGSDADMPAYRATEPGVGADGHVEEHKQKKGLFSRMKSAVKKRTHSGAEHALRLSELGVSGRVGEWASECVREAVGAATTRNGVAPFRLLGATPRVTRPQFGSRGGSWLPRRPCCGHGCL